jgi:hypothetical protein
MKLGDANALDIGFWWARSDVGKLTVIEVRTQDWLDDDEPGYGVLRGTIMWRDYSDSIEDLIGYGWVFVERIQEPAS